MSHLFHPDIVIGNDDTSSSSSEEETISSEEARRLMKAKKRATDSPKIKVKDIERLIKAYVDPKKDEKTKKQRKPRAKMPSEDSKVINLPHGVLKYRKKIKKDSDKMRSLKCINCNGYTDHHIQDSYIVASSGRKRYNVECSICGKQKSIQALPDTEEERYAELARIASRLRLSDCITPKQLKIKSKIVEVDEEPQKEAIESPD
jgi:hypothetical protein